MGLPQGVPPRPGRGRRRHRGHRGGLDESWDRNLTADGAGGRGGSGRGRRRVGFFARFTAYDSRRGTRGQLVGGTDWVQVAGIFSLESTAGRAQETTNLSISAFCTGRLDD